MHYRGFMRSNQTTWLLRAGLVLFAVGLLALAVLFGMPAVDDGATAPTLVYVLTMAAPVGLVVALIAVVLGGRTRNESARGR